MLVESAINQTNFIISTWSRSWPTEPFHRKMSQKGINLDFKIIEKMFS